MKRILWTLALLTAPVCLMAAENSNIYMPLVQSSTFTSRVQYILAQEVPSILTEASAVSCHAVRAKFAANVAQSPVTFAPVFAVHLVTNINVTSAGALTGSGATLDTPATDAALLAAVASLWSTVAGCVTNP